MLQLRQRKFIQLAMAAAMIQPRAAQAALAVERELHHDHTEQLPRRQIRVKTFVTLHPCGDLLGIGIAGGGGGLRRFWGG